MYSNQFSSGHIFLTNSIQLCILTNSIQVNKPVSYKKLCILTISSHVGARMHDSLLVQVLLF